MDRRHPARPPLAPSPRLPSVRPRANGTSACWLLSPSCRPASLRRSSMAPRLRTSRSPALPRPCPIRGPSRSRASDCDAAHWTGGAIAGNKCSRNPSHVGQRVCRGCGLRAGVRLIPDGRPANRSLSAIEPVCSTPKRKLENGEQRPAPKTRPARVEIPEIADQRLGPTSVTRGNVNGSHKPGNNTPETRLPG